MDTTETLALRALAWLLTFGFGYWLGRRQGIKRALVIVRQEFASYYRNN